MPRFLKKWLAVYDEESSSWTVQFESAEGLTRTGVFSAVISACGQLNTPPNNSTAHNASTAFFRGENELKDNSYSQGQ